MAEGFEPYHVPQQSRRDKLRVVDNLQGCAQLAPPLYDPSDFITPVNLRHTYNIPLNSAAGVKEEGMNSMNFVSNVNHMFVDPRLNPSSIQYLNNSNAYVYNPHCYATNQSLSLSLSSHHSNLPLELNLHDSSIFGNGGDDDNGGCSAAPIELSKSTVPLGPFTGYASVLKGSRFLKPAHQLLEELCDVGRGICAEKNGPDSGLLDPPVFCGVVADDSVNCSGDGSEQTRKKSRLLSMLDEVFFLINYQLLSCICLIDL